MVSEAAPPSVDNPEGAQAICGLFFGSGLIGAIAFSILVDQTKAVSPIVKGLVAFGTLPVSCAMYGWHSDNKVLIFTGMAVAGFTSE